MSTTVLTFPATLGEVLASGDASVTNPDVARTRASVTVGQALEAEEQEAVRRSVDAQFPAVAAFLADIERPAVKDLADADARALSPALAAAAALTPALPAAPRVIAYSARQLEGRLCGLCGEDLANAGRPWAVTADGRTLSACAPACDSLSDAVVQFFARLDRFITSQPNPAEAFDQVVAALEYEQLLNGRAHTSGGEGQ